MEFSSSSVNNTTNALSSAEHCSNGTVLCQERGDYDAPWLTIATYINLLLYILSVTGNGILISAYAKDFQMRTTTNMLVVSHLIAEFTASFFGIVTHVYTLMADKKPSATSVWCVVGTSMIKIGLGGGLLSLVGITVDRYLALVIKVHHKVTRRQVQVFVTVIWTLSIAYAIPWNLIFLDGRIYRWNHISWLIVNCHVHIADQSSHRTAVDIFHYVFLLLGVGSPLLIIAFTSFSILRTALKARRRVGIIGTSVNEITAAYVRSAITTIIIISVYFLCLIPIIALGAKCKYGYWNCRAGSLFFLAKVTLCFRSACFPVIFAARNRNFSRYIRRLLCKRVQRKCLHFDQRRRRSSTKVHVYRNCSRSWISNTKSEKTATTINVGRHAFHSTRKLAFVDLENIAIKDP